MGDKPRAELLGALASLYQSRDYSDLIIFARDGTRHPVHRAIVCPRSHYFYTAVREGQWKDGVDGHILLPDDEPEVIRLLLEYMYLLDYVPHPHNLLSDDDEDSTPPPSSRADSSDSVSTLSRDPAQYGNIYGASAISSFGGPHQHHHQSHLHPHQSSTYTNAPNLYLNRSRTESQLTVHALPLEYHGNFNPHQTRPRGNAESGLPDRKTGRPPSPSPLATPEPDLVLHALIYAAGRKYRIDGLSALALDKFKIQLTRHWDSPTLAEAIHVVYTSTVARDKEMRETVADALGWDARLLEKPEIEVAVCEISGLAYELLKRRMRGEVGGFVG